MTEYERGDLGVGGSSVKPIYSERSMKCYAVTEMELNNLGFASLVSTIFSTAGAVLLGLAIDLFKDVQIDGKTGSGAQAAESLQGPLFVGAVICFAVAVLMLWRRRNMIELIRKESKG